MKLHWVTENSLELQFPDGSKTKILLRPTSNIQDEATPCLFTGQLEDDLDSRVTVSGCLGDEETAVTIASSKVPSVSQNNQSHIMHHDQPHQGGWGCCGPIVHGDSNLPAWAHSICRLTVKSCGCYPSWQCQVISLIYPSPHI